MTARVRLEPLGRDVTAQAGTPLRDLLFAHGVEFPCGGRGTCRGCRVRITNGLLQPSAEDALLLTSSEIAEGWRLACRARVRADLVVEIQQWMSPVLDDATPLACPPRPGFGIAIDVGTTTLVAQLVDLRQRQVRGVRTALNPQAAWGADVMTRVQAALAAEGAAALRDAVRVEVRRMVCALVEQSPESPSRVVLVGNTAMHHLFCGVDVAPLAEAPFEPSRPGACTFAPGDLDWPLAADAEIRFLPCVAGFVGSDVLAGVRAVGLHESSRIQALIDLGTNAEVVVGSRDGLLCASTAAGPAFEGGRISVGMRAATGAIDEVTVVDGELRCRVLGGGPPRGLCGSGLVDAVRCGLDQGRIQPSGRLAGGAKTFELCGGVQLRQADIREVQLAKAAIASGLRLLLARLGGAVDDVDRVYLAGAFGNYVSRESARRIGLLAVEPARVRPAGNTALLGAKLALFDDALGALEDLRARITHVPLAASAEFQDTYVSEMGFPLP